jgi:GH25 family lysozyme M1 (1,4-beta-N-acetylmuramidase)
MIKQLLFISSLTFLSLSTTAQTILGVDVSSYQGTINWTQVKGAGYTFAWAKATEGLSVTDSQYKNNAVNGVAAGVYMGAYHFAHPDDNPTNADAIDEANYFLSVAGSYIVSCELPPVLDYEVSTSLTSAEQTAWIQNWMNTVKTATGITPILYTDGSIASSLGSSLASYCDLWIATDDGASTDIPPSSDLGAWNPNWSFNQYNWTGTVAGISGSGNVDLDVFNGNLTALKTLMGCFPAVCHTYYTSLPYSTSFENVWATDSCTNAAQRIPDIYWKSSTGGTTPNGNDYWHRDDYTGGDWTSTTTGTYTPGASAGSYSARFHNDPPPAGSTGALDLYINLAALGEKKIKFDYIHNESSPSPFAFNVLLSTDGGSTFPTTLLTITTAQMALWTTQTFTTNATSATSVLRFMVTDKGAQDVGIDNLSVVQLKDTIAPTTSVNVYNTWETQNFTTTFTDADNAGGSGLEKSYYQAIYYDGTQWGANYTHGFYADDFNTMLNPDWTSETGAWSINSNALYQSDTSLANTNIYAPLTQTLSNRYLYYFTAKIGGTGTNRRAGFHFFCDRPDSSNRNNSYFVWFRVDKSEMDIYKVVNNTYTTPVYTTAVTVNANQSYDYIIIYDRISGLMRVYQNNVLIGSWTDSSPYSSGGYISFRTGNATISVDQLRVYRSRNSSATITVGAGNTNDLEYQNTNPTTPAAHINSICSDSAANLSAFVSQPVNIDWTAALNLITVNNGTGINKDSVCISNQLSANWSTATDANSGVSNYEYAIGTTPGAQNIVAWTNNGNNTSVTKTGLSLSLGQKYYFSVKAVDGAGLVCDSINGNGVLTISCTTGINKLITEDSKITVYPNPNNGDFILAVDGSSKQIRADLYNDMGQFIMHRENNTGENIIHINDINEGIYFLTVFSDGIKIATRKLVVIR